MGERKFTLKDYIAANITVLFPLFFALFLLGVGIYSQVFITALIGSVITGFVCSGVLIDWRRKKKIIERK